VLAETLRSKVKERVVAQVRREHEDEINEEAERRLEALEGQVADCERGLDETVRQALGEDCYESWAGAVHSEAEALVPDDEDEGTT
jgi:hypothetical protein